MSEYSWHHDAMTGLHADNARETLELRALRADVLHLHWAKSNTEPTPSFALTDSAKAARSPTTVERTSVSTILRTPDITVSIETATSVFEITDSHGRDILRDVRIRWNETGGFTISARLDKDTMVLGLGDKPMTLDRRGRVYTNWTTDSYAFSEGQDPLYKAIPFFIAVTHGRATGVFLDNPQRSTFDIGSSDPTRLSFGAVGGEIDLYVLSGPVLADVLGAYGFLTGTPPLPPKWALGYQQSRYSYRTQAEVMTLAHRFRRENIPCDVIWLDLHVLDQRRSFTIDHKAFPDFPGMVRELHELGFAVVIITDFQVAKVDDGSYAPFPDGVAHNAFIHCPDGTLYSAPSWGGPSVFPDFTSEHARIWWGTQYRELVNAGVDGFWNDMNEPSLFTPDGTFAADIRHHLDDGTSRSHAELHNVYGMLNGRATHEGLTKLRPGERPFVMMRASYAGGHRHAVTWTGDNLSTWAHLRIASPMLTSLGLCGFAFATANIGGFVGTPTPELLTRWIQIGMYYPIALNHSDLPTPPQEPWVHGPDHLARRRAAIVGRYRLLPYLYTLAEHASRTGIPLMRPMMLEFPHAADGFPLDRAGASQFMLGKALLVAPELYGEMGTPYHVTLPPGTWYDFHTGQQLRGLEPASLIGNSGTSQELESTNETPHALTVTPTPEHIAVFARAGSIIPTQNAVEHVNMHPEGPLSLTCYAAGSCSGSLYDDDGISITPEAPIRLDFTATFDEKGTFTFSIGPRDRAAKPWWSQIAVTIHGIEKFSTLDGKTEATFDKKTKTLTFTLEDRAEGHHISGKGHIAT